jgi:hypothetical protein
MFATTPLFRCYPTPIEDGDEKKNPTPDPRFEADSAIAAEIARVGHPWAGPMVIFDCETLTDAHGGQRLRFLFFQERGCRYDRRIDAAKAGKLTRDMLDECWNKGIAYEPANCTEDEIEVLENYALEHDDVELMTRDEFVRKILHRNHYVKFADDWKERLREPCLVIGHNVPFDMGAIAIHCGLAKDDLYGGLSLVLSGGEYDEKVVGETDEAFAARVEIARKAGLPEPRRRGEAGVAKEKFEYRTAIKKIGFNKALYRDGAQINGAYIGENGKARPRHMEMLHFVDTGTLGRALLGPEPTKMDALLERLNVPKKFRKKTADYDGPITDEYIGYCRSDVQNTWEIFKAERELYLKHGRSKLLHHLLSEALLGKAYFEDLGIQGFNELKKGARLLDGGLLRRPRRGAGATCDRRGDLLRLQEPVPHDQRAYEVARAARGWASWGALGSKRGVRVTTRRDP